MHRATKETIKLTKDIVSAFEHDRVDFVPMPVINQKQKQELITESKRLLCVIEEEIQIQIQDQSNEHRF